MNTKTIIIVIMAIAMIGAATAMMTTTQTAQAKENCEINPDGSLTCSGGGATSSPQSTGGGGGHITCDAENICTDQGGDGRHTETETPIGADVVGAPGARVTGANSGDEESVGGEGIHRQGPGGNSEK